jgi:hypothetical protein
METKMFKTLSQRIAGRKGSAGRESSVIARKRKLSSTKKQIARSLLHRREGTSIADLRAAIDWQAHSVRGLLAGSIKKMAGVPLTSEMGEGGCRRYFIMGPGNERRSAGWIVDKASFHRRPGP